jgi:hypothetical protein
MVRFLLHLGDRISYRKHCLALGKSPTGYVNGLEAAKLELGEKTNSPFPTFTVVSHQCLHRFRDVHLSHLITISRVIRPWKYG